MFSDLLEIARELHENGCKDAAAVQAGTALELHLRLLAAKHNIETVRLVRSLASIQDQTKSP